MYILYRVDDRMLSIQKRKFHNDMYEFNFVHVIPYTLIRLKVIIVTIKFRYVQKLTYFELYDDAHEIGRAHV